MANDEYLEDVLPHCCFDFFSAAIPLGVESMMAICSLTILFDT